MGRASVQRNPARAHALRWHMRSLPRRVKYCKGSTIAAHADYQRYARLLRRRRDSVSVRPASLTIVVTSAGRLPYLKQTVESLRDNLEPGGFESVTWAIIDDDPTATETRDWIQKHGHFDTRIFPSRNLRLGGALNTVLLRVGTEYVFHSEDDWQYLRPLHLQRFAELLCNSSLMASQILAYREPIVSIEKEYQGARTVSPGLGAVLDYSFNPHMFRLAHYLEYGPIPVFRREEEDYSEKLKALSSHRPYIYDYLRSPMVRHIGYESKLFQGRQWPQRSAEWVANQYRRHEAQGGK